MKTVFIKDFTNAKTEKELRNLLSVHAQECELNININEDWDSLYESKEEIGGITEEMIEQAVVNKNRNGYATGVYADWKGSIKKIVELKDWMLKDAIER